MKPRTVAAAFRLPDELWKRIEPHLPVYSENPKGGRPRIAWRRVLDGIFYVLRTGCQWKAVPPEFGSGSTLHRYFQVLADQGLFELIWAIALTEYDELQGIEWRWQSMDGAMTKAPLGGKKTGPNPTDRAKRGTKRSLLTDGAGVPLGVTVAGANTHDKWLVEATLESIPVEPPHPDEVEQNLCLDKGYDYRDVRDLVDEWGYVGHIKSRGDEQRARERMPGYRARRYVCERTHSWMNRFRRLLIRWEKKPANYLAMIHLVCAYITWNAAGVLG